MEKLAIHVTPKAGKDALAGWVTDAAGQRELAVRVAAVPENGKATKAACKLVAKSLGVPASAVTCVRGNTSRHKQLEIDCAPDKLAAWLATLT